MKELIWLHDEWLLGDGKLEDFTNAKELIHQKALDGVRGSEDIEVKCCVFIDDIEFFIQRGWSYKRYSYLIRLVENFQIPVLRGSTKTVLRGIGKYKILSRKARDPYLFALQESVAKYTELELIEQPTLSFPRMAKAPGFMKFYFKNQNRILQSFEPNDQNKDSQEQ